MLQQWSNVSNGSPASGTRYDELTRHDDDEDRFDDDDDNDYDYDDDDLDDHDKSRK